MRGSVLDVLRLFYRMALFDADFDTALIEFLKQATGNFIRKEQSMNMDNRETIKDMVQSTNKVSVTRFIQDIVLKNEEDPHTIIFTVVPLAMRVGLELIEYPSPSEDNKSPYSARTASFHFELPDGLNFHEGSIRLLRSDRLLYDVLYTNEDIKAAPSFLKYDEGIDAVPTSDGAQILEPICCKQGYYLPGYFRTMVNKRKKVIRKCVVCGQELDELSFKKLKECEKGWPYAFIIVAGLSLVVYAVTTFFAIDHALFF